MDVTVLQLAVFLGATFVAAWVAAVTGFAFALIATAAWLHVLTPLQTVTLTISFGLIVQGYGAWKVRHAFNWRRIWPFVLGGAPGAAIGAQVVRWADPTHLRAGMAAFIVFYAIYGFIRPDWRPIRAGTAADVVVGMLSGMLGTIAGFPGILVVIWCGLRGWGKDEQRAVFQPAAVALLAMSAIALTATGSVNRQTFELFAIGLPVLAAGTWAGFAFYGRLDEAAFRRVVLIMLVLSGVFLIASLV